MLTRRNLGALLTVVALAPLTACGVSKEEEACREQYRRDQTLRGRVPSDKEVRDACDRNGTHPYARTFYGSSRRANTTRGGGSGSGK